VPADAQPEGAVKEACPWRKMRRYSLVERFRNTLGERMSDVRTTDRLIDSPCASGRQEGSLNQEVQRVYRMLKRV
jgi:HSP90 family molecular chaperone